MPVSILRFQGLASRTVAKCFVYIDRTRTAVGNVSQLQAAGGGYSGDAILLQLNLMLNENLWKKYLKSFEIISLFNYK